MGKKQPRIGIAQVVMPVWYGTDQISYVIKQLMERLDRIHCDVTTTRVKMKKNPDGPGRLIIVSMRKL